MIFSTPASAESFRAQVEHRTHGTTSSYELTMVTRSGERIPTVHSGRALHDVDGTFLGSFAVITDVGERRQILERLLRSEDALRETRDRLAHEALHDALTGLANRTLFKDRLEHALERRFPGERCAVLHLDLDRFKTINESLGPAVGDHLLHEVGRRLETAIRPDDTLARLSGDGFSILLEGVSDAKAAVRAAQRVHAAFETPFELAGREVYLSTSVGVALAAGKGSSSAEEVLRDADIAMSRAKQLGGADTAVFDTHMHAQAVEQLQLETALRRAVDQWQFEVVYQPIVHLESGRLAGLEALLRWHHPERGLVTPDEFIAVAEDLGLIATLGSRVLAEACLQTREWQDLLGTDRPGFVTVNLAERQLTESSLVERIERVLRESGLAADSLVLEISEDALGGDLETLLPVLEQLKQRGICLLLDGFGPSRAALEPLHRLPVDMIKIDRWLVRSLEQDQGSADLVEGMMALCRWRGLEPIAIGLETAEQRRRLSELGCAYGQGFLFAAPGSAADTETLLQSRTGDAGQPLR